MAKLTIDKLSGRPLLHSHRASDISELDETLLYNQFYGVRRQRGQTSSVLTRIGNPDLHKAVGGLPIQNAMRRCLLLPDGTVNYYLDANDSTKTETGAAADLTGADGHVMVEIPAHYYKAWEETIGATVYENYAISQFALPGFTLIEKHYISAYEASLNRSTGAAASVVNNTTTYRGGNNTSAWDAAANSLLGKPVTNLTCAQEQAAAELIGTGWTEEPFQFFWPWRWLALIEFANTNGQLAVNNALTAEGYRQGGLGNGITTANTTEWNNFNAYNPFWSNGITNSLGNSSGEVEFTVTDFGGAGIDRTFKANSYRGISIPFGGIWKRLQGVNINRTGGKVLVYVKNGVTAFVNDTASGYDFLGEMPYSSDYILDLIFPYFLPRNNGGGSTTGFCDYYYYPSSDGWKAPLLSATSPNGSAAGFACVYANLSAALAYVDIGFRLCFKP
jgi:hypothetical protein